MRSFKVILAFLPLLLFSCQADATTHVQGNISTFNSAAGQASFAATGSAIGAGNIVLGAAIWYEDSGSASHLTSVTDDKGNTYSLKDAPTNGGAGARFLQSFALKVPTGGPATITANFTGGTVNSTQMVWDEYSFTETRVVGTHNGSNSATTSGNFSTVNPNALIWGAGMNSSGNANSASAGSGFLQREYDGTINTNNLLSEDMTLATPGVTAATITTAQAFGEVVGIAVEVVCNAGSLALTGVGC